MARKKILSSISESYENLIITRETIDVVHSILSELGSVEIKSGNYECQNTQDIFSAPPEQRLPISFMVNLKIPDDSRVPYGLIHYDIKFKVNEVSIYIGTDRDEDIERKSRIVEELTRRPWNCRTELLAERNNFVSKAYNISMISIFGLYIIIVGCALLFFNYETYARSIITNSSLYINILLFGLLALSIYRDYWFSKHLNITPKLVYALNVNEEIPKRIERIPKAITAILLTLWGLVFSHFVPYIWKAIGL
jgi:hypothetical protein